MDCQVYTGFTSHCNEQWISFGPPTYDRMGGHPINWTDVAAPAAPTTHPREFRPGDYSDDPRFLAAVQLRHRIIVRTGELPELQNDSLERMLLKLVQLALKHNLV